MPSPSTKRTADALRAVREATLNPLLILLAYAPAGYVTVLAFDALLPAVVMTAPLVITFILFILATATPGALRIALLLPVAWFNTVAVSIQARGWNRIVTYALGWFLTATVISAAVTQNWIAGIVTAVVFALNWWVVSGRPFRHIKIGGGKTRRGSATSLERDLALALKDFFAPAANYRVKPSNGDAYVDEKARLADTRARITAVTEIRPNVFRVDIRNDSGQPDDRLLKELEATASILGLYAWEPVDEDPRKGYVTITVWQTERKDATSSVNGLLMWTQGENQ